MVDDFSGWYRVGRGRSLQFYATDDEVADWLLDTLPAEFGPYFVFRPEWAHPRFVVRQRRIDDIALSFSEDRYARHWIKSGAISPALQPDDIAVPNDLAKLSSSGLIAIRLVDDRRGPLEPADLGLIDRIRHGETGEERRQAEYLRIFERLRRAMRKRLVVQTADWPMTARAAAELARGKA